jgi:sec-independent protein translocase protein TatA
MLVGNTELLVVLAIAVLLFGGSKIPELARSLGRAKVEFKRGMREEGGER